MERATVRAERQARCLDSTGTMEKEWWMARRREKRQQS